MRTARNSARAPRGHASAGCAALSSRSAAALASAVISAPASMRAISSRRWSAASALTRVATRLPLSSASLEISRCWSARAATCGAWVTAITCTLPASRASRAPMASATAPPTPVSISSNTSVGAEPRSDSTTFSASRKRDSSPPEATFISGPGLVPGIGLHPELDAVEALRARRGLVGLDLGHEFCALELERRELGIDGLVELLGRFLPRHRQLLGGRRIARIGLDRGLLQLLQPRGAGIDQHDVGGVFGGKRGEPIDRRRIFARGGAQREQPLLDAFELAPDRNRSRQARPGDAGRPPPAR